MIPNNTISVLPFYDSVEKQNHRKDYAFGEIYSLITPNKKILPFQICRDHRLDDFFKINLRNIDGTIHANILSEMVSTGLVINQYDSYGYDIIQYPGIFQLATDTPEGLYYVELSDGIETWYSEVFNIVRNVDDYLSVQYWDYESLLFDDGRIDYTGGFKNIIYLPTQIGRPDYEFKDTVEELNGYTFPEKQISEKTYKFNFVAPEFLLDAIRIIRLSDKKIIRCKGETYDADSFLMTPKWLNGGFYASVEVEFQCNTIIKKIGICLPPGTGGDFNNDFNNDFTNIQNNS